MGKCIFVEVSELLSSHNGFLTRICPRMIQSALDLYLTIETEDIFSVRLYQKVYILRESI